MTAIFRTTIMLYFCAIAGLMTADPLEARAQHAPPIHSVPFHPPVVHTPSVHITPIHVEPIHVTPIHSEPVHTATVHSDAISPHMTTRLLLEPHASAHPAYHAPSPSRSTSSVGMGSFDHHGSNGGGGGNGRGGGGGGGKSPSLTQTYNKASVTSLHSSTSSPTNFKAHSSSNFSGKSQGLQYRGERSLTGERTIQRHVEKAVDKAGGNPTVVRNGRELSRFRTGRHMETANVTPQNVRNVDRLGQPHYGKGPDRLVTKKDMKELYKYQSGQIEGRTLSGKNKK
jgi:hypothetical protein